MANSITHAALPYCICGARFSLVLGFETSAGVPTDPASSDTEYSVDGGASFADCAEEITTGGSAGVGYLTLTGAETNNSVLAIRSRSSNCDDATRVIPIMALASVGTGTLSAGSAGGGTLGTILAYDVTGCFIKTTGGTGGGGTGGANNQARKIATYNTSTGAFTVTPNWETTPDNTTTYAVLLPDGVTLGMLQAINPATPGRKPVVDASGLVDANTVKVGPTGSGTAQTAGDIPARLPAALTTNGNMKSSLLEIISTALTEGATGRIAAAWQAAWNVASSAWTSASVNQTGDSFARIGAAGAGLTDLGGMSITMKAQVNAEADTALVDAKAAYATEIEAAILNEGDATALLAAISAKVEEFLINDGDSAATLAAIASAVRTALATELARIDVATSTRLAAVGYTAPDNANIALIKAKTDNLPPAPAAVGDIPTAAAITDAVWDELQSGHTTSGTFGKFLDRQVSTISGGGGGGDCPTASEVAAEVVAQIAGEQIRLTTPDLAGELKQTTQGMAYTAAMGNRVEWSDMYSNWPTLTGGTVTLKIGQGGTPLTFTGDLIVPTGSGKRVGVEFTEVDSALISVADGEDNDAWPYILYIDLAGDLCELRRGRWISTPLPV
jgi:drug/metabolite transporter superfamily protein YnfA